MNNQEFQEGLETEQGQPRRVGVPGTENGGPPQSPWSARARFQAEALLTLAEARSSPSLYRTVVPSQQGQFQVYPQTRSTDSHHSEYRQAGFARTVCLDDAVL